MGYSVAMESFASLEKRWQELLAASATNHILLTPQWQRAWWQAFGRGRDLLLLSVQRDSELMGVIPLMRQGERISFIGRSDVCDYMDLVARQGEEVAVLSQLLDYIEPLDWDAIDLQSLLPHSLVLSHFVPLARQRGYLIDITKEDVSPELVLPSALACCARCSASGKASSGAKSASIYSEVPSAISPTSAVGMCRYTAV